MNWSQLRCIMWAGGNSMPTPSWLGCRYLLDWPVNGLYWICIHQLLLNIPPSLSASVWYFGNSAIWIQIFFNFPIKSLLFTAMNCLWEKNCLLFVLGMFIVFTNRQPPAPASVDWMLRRGSYSCEIVFNLKYLRTQTERGLSFWNDILII